MKTITITTQEELKTIPREFEKEQIVEIRAKEVITIKDKYVNVVFYAYDSSRVNAYNSSRVTAYGSSRVNAYDSSRVTAYGSSIVNAYDSSIVYASDSSTVNAYDSSIVNTYSSSTVYAYDSSTVYAYLVSTVFISSKLVTLSKLLDNSRAVYLVSDANKPLIKDNKASITEFSELVTPTFDQWIERGVVFADGIYQSLISQKTIGEITVYETDQGFVVRKGDKFAHGKNIEEAKNDLRYKISDRDTSRFRNWKLSDVKSTDELIECYRTITGACSQGTKIFCESIQLKNQYSVQEIVDLTSGRFGNEEFRKFFGGGLKEDINHMKNNLEEVL